MTVVGDEVIKLLELGDVFRWVTDRERAKALELLERDSRFDATITQLQSGKVLRDFFTRYFNQQSAPSLYDAVMLMAAKAGPVSVSSIENNLAGFFFSTGMQQSSTRNLAIRQRCSGLQTIWPTACASTACFRSAPRNPSPVRLFPLVHPRLSQAAVQRDATSSITAFLRLTRHASSMSRRQIRKVILAHPVPCRAVTPIRSGMA